MVPLVQIEVHTEESANLLRCACIVRSPLLSSLFLLFSIFHHHDTTSIYTRWRSSTSSAQHLHHHHQQRHWGCIAFARKLPSRMEPSSHYDHPHQLLFSLIVVVLLAFSSPAAFVHCDPVGMIRLVWRWDWERRTACHWWFIKFWSNHFLFTSCRAHSEDGPLADPYWPLPLQTAAQWAGRSLACSHGTTIFFHVSLGYHFIPTKSA